MLRAVVILVLVIGLSIGATWYFGAEVLIALGLIATQIKVLFKKLAMIEWPALILWLKTQTAAFFRVELLKKWLMSTAMPLVLGRTVLRRISAALRGYLSGVTRRFESMMEWFRGLGPMEKALAWAIILFATLGLSVTSLGLWLVLFSVQLPLWVVAAAASFGKMIWTSLHKWAFKALAFFQLGWLWRGIRWFLPRRWLDAKRRWDYRVARAVIRRRRLTIRQVAERKDRLPFRMGVMVEYLFGGSKP
ncbi:hypothetical protein [Thalassococcus lentus]|uniref:Uncharacterized protein n=1 Tax=Thalassococcus lentus TaxID=1210524 RepID=A0ABT4XRY7_9RHOB|nr:hypothetical protein [Thalassococcus lentus]MDA7424716.1 hypothetical protein [Thalassococcus lentus]